MDLLKGITSAQLQHHKDMDDKLVMQMSPSHSIPKELYVTSVDELCCVMKIKQKNGKDEQKAVDKEEEKEKEDKNTSSEVRNRKKRAAPKSSQEEEDDDGKTVSECNIQEEKDIFSVDIVSHYQTDFADGEDILQKVAKFTFNDEYVVTGGTDGCVRVWQVSTYISNYNGLRYY